MPLKLAFVSLASCAALSLIGCGEAHDARFKGGVLRSIALSASHSCALRQAGLYCWGDNFAGQLGDGSEDASDTPVRASIAGEGIAEVAATTGRTCVRRSTGAVACWGNNELAETAIDAVQLAIDDASTCALRADGDVACWRSVPEPESIAGLADVVSLSGGILGTYCALTAGGAVRCFKLDHGAWTEPTEVTELADARAIAVTGYNVVCAIASSGEVLCHNLESGTTLPLERSEGSVELVGTFLVACARKGSGDWTCWNILPPMLETVGSPAIAVPSEVPIVELQVAGLRACGIREDRSVVCATAGVVTPELMVVDGLPP